MHEASIRRPTPVREWIAESPLVPVALACTAGVVIDRHLDCPVWLEILVLLAGVCGWIAAARAANRTGMAWACVAFAATAALHHHGWHIPAADDVGSFAGEAPRLARLRGTLDQEPAVVRRPRDPALVTYLRPDPTRTVLAVEAIQGDDGWEPASGRARLTVEGPLTGLHVGDSIELMGWLERPRGPLNPGEFDHRRHLADDRIRAEVRVRGAGTVTRLHEGWRGTFRGWLARLRGVGQRAIAAELPERQAPLAEALLLGDGAAMATADWDRYLRTGVIHVLAISGQHLAILATVLGFALRVGSVPRRPAALIVAAALIGYAVLTGFRPPVQRAAVIAGVTCAAALMRRLTLPANAFALAWIAVIALDPTEIFGMGCQVSFLNVALLTWGTGRLLDRGEIDPLERLIDRTRSVRERRLRAIARFIGEAYLVSLVLGLGSLPLLAARQNLVSLSGLLIGPPVILLSSVALIAGFVMLVLSPLGLGFLAAWLVRTCLAMCDWLVDVALALPGGHFHVPDLAAWWLVVFYAGLLALLWVKPCWPRRRWFALGGAAWIVLGLATPMFRPPSDELRVTFLAVGPGGCTVIETPDGRVLLYDAGAMGGPELIRRQVAPFLWSRGHRAVDEVFLSHADLDHFNGVADLLERFRVGRVTLTPSFADKASPAVRRTRAAIAEHGVPTRIVTAGDRLAAGDVALEVLHPPASGPAGEENARSMVLRLDFQGLSILLTGDLQTPGLEMVTAGPGGAADVVMAPHHGSPASNTPAFAAWARPRLAVVCESAPRAGAAYAAPVWVTGVEGAVTVRIHATGLVAETFATGQFMVLRPRPDGESSVKAADLIGPRGRAVPR